MFTREYSNFGHLKLLKSKVIASFCGHKACSTGARQPHGRPGRPPLTRHFFGGVMFLEMKSIKVYHPNKERGISVYNISIIYQVMCECPIIHWSHSISGISGVHCGAASPKYWWSLKNHRPRSIGTLKDLESIDPISSWRFWTSTYPLVN